MSNNTEDHVTQQAKLYTEIELLKRDHLQLKEIFQKLDISVEKIAEAATNISKLLALHEQRVEMMSEEVYYFRDNTTKIQTEVHEIKTALAEQEKRVSKIEGFRWYLIGIATAAAFIINNFSSIMDFNHK